jgi:psiF repeat
MKALALGLAAALMMSATGAIAADDKTMTKEPTAKTMKAPKAPKVKKDPVAHSEISKKCSADADVQKLHGKARKSFRKACMKKAA